MTYWNSPEFKALQQAWYAKLEDEGFQDAEELVGEEMMLRQVAEHAYKDSDELGVKTKEAYYRILEHRVQGSAFQNDIDRLIMTMFADGTKIKRIVETLEDRGSRRCRMTVRMTIRRYEMKWGLRDYSRKQLNKRAPPKSA